MPKKQRTVKRTLLTGLVILTPLLVTGWVVRFVFRQIHQFMTPTVLSFLHLVGPGKNLESTVLRFGVPVISVLVAILSIYLLGLLGGNVIGRQFLQGIEQLLMKIPVIRGIYSATRKFLETFSSDKSQAFRTVVLIEYPRRGLWTMGLVSNPTRGEVAQKVDAPMVSVFIPTTPNPTSGWLLFVPKSDVIELEMSVDDAFKMIVSGGILTPPTPENRAPATL